MNVSRGGSFNCRFGRDPAVVLAEINALMAKHDLDWLALQEADDYGRALDEAGGLTFFRGRIPETGIVVREGVEATNFRYGTFGDGWFTVFGHRHHATAFPRVTIEGWLRVASVHYPTPTVWQNGVLNAPPERLDDYMELARKTKKFLSKEDPLTRVVVGDFNEPPRTTGAWSPAWIATETGSQIAFPRQLAGHGRIDGALIKSGIGETFKDLAIAEASDHEPVVLTVTQSLQ